MNKALKVKMIRLKADTIREDGRLERMCEHGVGHPVGHVYNEMTYKLGGQYMWLHGCCGARCCRYWAKEGKDA